MKTRETELDDGKRTELICFKVSKRMAFDLERSAATRSRSVSDSLYVATRHFLYGNIARLDRDAEFIRSNKVAQYAEAEA